MRTKEKKRKALALAAGDYILYLAEDRKKIAHSTFFLELFPVMMITDGAYVFLLVLYCTEPCKHDLFCMFIPETL